MKGAAVSNIAAASSATANLATVKAVYAAFGRGDVPAILELVAEDVRWEHWADSFAHRAGVPWLRAHSGPEGVAEFFSVVGTFEISEFSVDDLMGSENQVTAEVVIDAKLPDGGHYRDEELHLWTFDSAGKISRMRHYTDTAKHIAAARGEDTTAR
jgi:ketosteroid isomerase-like protein